MRNRLTDIFWSVLPIDTESKTELKEERARIHQNSMSDAIHLEETLQWICRAQDSSSDDGVARAFKASYYKGFGVYGWQPSYPETTGYIIPTFLAASKFNNDPLLKQRAIRMADWEITIQLPSGAVMASVVTAPPTPAVFNTGQVIFGWVAAFKETQEKRYLKAANRAASYLLSVQEPDGSWKKGNSSYALHNSTVYNSRVAWALIELGRLCQNSDYINAGIKNINFVIKKQKPNGWFEDNCLNDPLRPLLHTIVYATRGVLEAGIQLKADRFKSAALKTLEALLRCQRPDGGLPGRLDMKWNQQASWDCVTGDAQVAIAWLRASVLTGDSKYETAARKAIDFIKQTQSLEHPNLGIRGGVKGSFPFNGDYGKFEMLNWAAKFFCDALLMKNDSSLAQQGIPG